MVLLLQCGVTFPAAESFTHQQTYCTTEILVLFLAAAAKGERDIFNDLKQLRLQMAKD